jgi:hypothetical protein
MALGARSSGWPGATNLAQAEPEPDEVDLCRGVSPQAFFPKKNAGPSPARGLQALPSCNRQPEQVGRVPAQAQPEPNSSPTRAQPEPSPNLRAIPDLAQLCENVL